MSDFRVVSESVAGLGALVTRAGQSAGTFVNALSDNATTSTGDGIFGLIEDPLERLRWYGQHNTQRARDLAQASGEELVKSAKFYSELDGEEAGKLDRTYHPASSTRKDEWNLPGAIATKSFADVADAGGSRCYTGKDYEVMFDKALRRDQWAVDFEKELNKLSEHTSFAGTVGGYMKKFCGRNPLEEAAKLISGDWMQIYRESVVFVEASKAFVLIGKNIDRGRFAIQDDWDGNAASGAENWLDSYSKSCKDHAEYLEDAARKMERLAMAAYHRFSSLNIAIGTAIDTLAELATAGKVFGKIKNFVGKAIEGEISAQDWNQLKEYAAVVSGIVAILDMFWAFAHEYAALLAVFAGQGEVVAGTWPCMPFDHPAVS